MITAGQLNNFWKVRDTVQGICCELESIAVDEKLEKSAAEGVLSDYEYVKNLINEIAKTGYFDKKADETKRVEKLVNDIISVESKNAELIKNIWKKDITDIKKFRNGDFKLCIKPIFAGTIGEVISKLAEAYNLRPNFITSVLVSNSNITLTDPRDITCAISDVPPYGFVYGIDKNFVAATDSLGVVSIKKSEEISDGDFITANKGEEYLFVNGLATRLKTPKQIIRNNSSKRFTQNYNTVVLDGETTRPVAVFYYGFGLLQTSRLRKVLEPVAQRLGLPVVEVDMHQFYKSNGKFVSNTALLRSLFNRFVRLLMADLSDFAGTDIWSEVRKLVGCNTNLRLNFVYKYFLTLKKHLSENNELSADEFREFAAKAIVKSVLKHNKLMQEREKANGGPLIYPNEDTPVAVPIAFSTADI
ncbi:MAG: hypothetical protein LBN07_00225 [Christensenellaceae bacterium]|jgi:hypothetical protein|nr:hypothetical protein [Christensenellaceae bacterium]